MNDTLDDNTETTEVERADQESAATLAAPDEVDARQDHDAGYTPEACQRFAEGLDEPTLERLVVVLEHIFALGSIDEERLADALGIAPVELWGTVTNPLKLHVKSLDLPLPLEVVTVGGESYWEDSLGIAGLLATVIRDEIDRRHVDEPAEESGDTTAPTAGRDRYAALLAHLAAQPEGESVSMGLEEIEGVIGFELPPKAWADESWWTRDANVPYRHHTRAWRDTGRLAEPDLSGLRITFQVVREEQPAVTEGGLRRITKALFRRKGASAEPEAHEPVDSTPVETEGLGVLREPADSGPYTSGLCAEFAAGMSNRALDTAHALFSEFAAHGGVDSPTLAEQLDCEPSSLAGMVAGPLRRRAKALGCEVPYRSVRGRSGAATMWLPTDGAMPNMADAIALERARRRA